MKWNWTARKYQNEIQIKWATYLRQNPIAMKERYLTNTDIYLGEETNCVDVEEMK